MTLREITEEFLLYLSAVRGLSKNTLIAYDNDLKYLQEFLTPDLDIKTVTSENLFLCVGQLSKQKKLKLKKVSNIIICCIVYHILYTIN